MPEAFILGEKFINNQNVCLILGDNFFYGQNLSKILQNCSKLKNGAKVLLHRVNNPESFGVAKVLGKKINELKGKQAADAQKFETAFERSTGKIQGALVDVLSIIANKKQLNLVLAKSQVILVGKDIDLTDDAIKELNKVLPKISLDK